MVSHVMAAPVSYQNMVVASEGAIVFGSNVTVTGEVGEYLPPLDPAWIPEPGTPGGQDVSLSRDESLALSVGAYNDWSLERAATLNLSAGCYVLNNLQMARDSVIDIDTSAGDVTVNVVGSLLTEPYVVFQKSGAGYFILNVFGGDATFGRNNQMTGTLRVCNGSLSVGRDAQLTGHYFATEGIDIGNNSLVTLGTGAPVPEPAVLWLLCAGLMAQVTRKSYPCIIAHRD